MDAPDLGQNGINIHAVLEMIVNDVPAPKGDREAPLQCLIFDSQYDSYRGAIVYMRVVNGVVKPGMDIKMMSTGAVYKVVGSGICIRSACARPMRSARARSAISRLPSRPSPIQESAIPLRASKIRLRSASRL